MLLLHDARLDDVADADEPDQRAVIEHRKMPEPAGRHHLHRLRHRRLRRRGLQLPRHQLVDGRSSVAAPCFASALTISRSLMMPRGLACRRQHQHRADAFGREQGGDLGDRLPRPDTYDVVTLCA